MSVNYFKFAFVGDTVSGFCLSLSYSSVLSSWTLHLSITPFNSDINYDRYQMSMSSVRCGKNQLD